MASLLTGRIHFSIMPLLLAFMAPIASAQISPMATLEHGIDAEQGRLSYSVPVPLPIGINGHTPKLSIDYQPGQGNGNLGMNFSLGGLPVIQRCAAQRLIDGAAGALLYNDQDQYCLNGERLILTEGTLGKANSEYVTSLNRFLKISALGQTGKGPTSWRVNYPNGTQQLLGNDTDSRSISTNGSVVSWHLSQYVDNFGNQINYRYHSNASQKLLQNISYGPYSVDLNYQQRPDQFQAYVAGQLINQNLRLDHIQINSQQQARSNVRLGYEQANGFSRLVSLQQCAGNSSSDCAPATQLHWGEVPETASQIWTLGDVPNNFVTYRTADLNRDGFTDLCYLDQRGLSCGLSQQGNRPTQFSVWAPQLSDSKWRQLDTSTSLVLLDLNNDLYVDYCITSKQGVYCGLNQHGGQFGAPKYWRTGEIKQPQFVDINHDQQYDLCTTNPSTQCYLSSGQGFNSSAITVSSHTWVTFDGQSSASFMDINGDNRQDLCGQQANGFSCQLNQGKGSAGHDTFASPTVWSSQLNQSWLNRPHALASLRYGQLNGDHLPDVCLRDGLTIKCALNNGFSFNNFSTWHQLPSGYDTPTASRPGEDTSQGVYNDSLTLLDWNQDGLDDLCSGQSNQRFTCGFNRQNSFNSQAQVAPFYSSLEQIDGKWPRHSPFNSVDINSDAVTDVCYRGTDGITCSLGQAKNYGQLTGITTGLGVETQVTYGRLTDPDIYQQMSSTDAKLVAVTTNQEVVRQISRSNAVGSSNVTTFTYGGLFYHSQEGFTPFYRERRDHSEDQSSHYRLNYLTGAKSGHRYASITKVNEQTTKIDIDFKEVITEKSQPLVRRLRDTKNWQLFYDYNNGNMTHYDVEWFINRDAYDNATFVFNMIGGSTGYKAKGEFYQFSNDTQGWHLGLPTSQINVILRQASGEFTLNLVSKQSSYTEQGALAFTRINPGSSTALNSRYEYDQYGNTIKITQTDQSQTRITSQTFTSDGLNIASRTNALNHTQSWHYDQRCQQPSQHTDANGLQTQWQYDRHCRQSQELRPDGTRTDIQFSWDEAGIAGINMADNSVYAIAVTTSGRPTKTHFYDALQREVRSHTLGYDGRPVYEDNVYDERGLVIKSSMPYFVGEYPGANSQWITTDYDALGRQVRVNRPSRDGGDVTTYGYDGLDHWKTSPMGVTTTTYMSVDGLPTSIKEFNGASNIDYRHNAEGLLTYSNANGVIMENTYDALGNKTSSTDPSLGSWRYGYNGFGELVSQTDAKGQVSTISYDLLGRKTKRTDVDTVTEWTYDQGHKAIGKLSQATTTGSTGVSSETFVYDDYGRLSSNSQTIDNQVHTTITSYNNDGQVGSVTLPDSVRYDNIYEHGLLKRIDVPRALIWDFDYARIEAAIDDYQQQMDALNDLIQESRQLEVYYGTEAARFNATALAWRAESDDLVADAEELEFAAAQLRAQAQAKRNDANYYSGKAAHFARHYANILFVYKGYSNGHYRYTYSRQRGCADWDWNWKGTKATCARYNYSHTHEYINQTVRQLAQQAGVDSTSGIYPHRYYAAIANMLSNLANNANSQAQNNSNQADQVRQRIAQLRSDADDYMRQAQASLDEARAIHEDIVDYNDQLDALTEAQLAAQAELERHNQGNTDYLTMWTAVNRDATGRLMSEKAGNQLITHREFDPFNGQLMNLRTGSGIALDEDQPLRHLSYTYDEHQNVTERLDLANQLTESYQYDAFDRIQQTHSQHDSFEQTRTYEYDLRGNMTYKSDTGDMHYNEHNQLTQLDLNNGSSSQYGYDANGNQTHGNGRSMTWNSFNKLARLSQNGHNTEFWYGPDRQRLKQLANRRDGSVHTSYYLNPVYRSNRLVDGQGNVTEQTQHFIFADGKAVGILVRSLDNGRKNADQFRYLHQDNLDSIDTITDANGLPVERLSFGAFGERRQVTGAPLEDPTRNPSVLTERGYTGHEHLDQVELIHMNARVYDPQTARFLSPDTVLQAPDHSQNHNRYLYVMNNPLKYTDPDGHRFRSKAKSRKSHSQTRQHHGRNGIYKDRGGHPSANQNNGGTNGSRRPGNSGGGSGGNGNNRRPAPKPKPKPKANPSNVAGGTPEASLYSNGDLAKQYGFYGRRKGSEQNRNERYVGEVYVTGHRVGSIGPVHMAIEYSDIYGKSLTLSAGPVDGLLVSDLNRPSDAPANNFTVDVVTPPEGMSVENYVESLIQADSSYCDCVDYDLFPGVADSFNSNSYVHGLLNATGGKTSANLGDYYGGNDPLPNHYFQANQ